MRIKRGTPFAEAYPEKVHLWSERNEVTPWDVTHSSKDKLWWNCEKGHEWRTAVGDLRNCPYCSGRLAIPGENDLGTLDPDLAREWHTTRNGGLTPRDVKPGSKKGVWWEGKCGHEWKTSVGDRAVQGKGCPYCSGRLVLPGFNDLETMEPHALTKWDYAKNEGLNPSAVPPGSHKKVHWTDTCGHSWYASVRNVAQKGYGCAVCAGKHGGFGENTLSATEPSIASEWHPDNDRTPEEVTRVSSYRAMWRCSEGHEFSVRVCDRVNYQTRCPKCSMTSESRAEKGLAMYVATLGVRVSENDREAVKGFEADVYCPDQGVAIEFNGLYWHSEKFRGRMYHSDKTDAFLAAGVQLIHVWEDDWNLRRGVVERLIARKLGVSRERVINARSLTPGVATAVEARKFLTENHIQGFVPASAQIALREGQEIAALASFRKRAGGTWELARYATSANVRGGFTKALKAFVRRGNPQEIVTFADRGVSDGGLYEKSGFTRDGEVAPDYKYVRNGREREHKFNYRKKRFRDDPKLKFREGATERELAEMNNLYRLYDSGKVRWVWRP